MSGSSLFCATLRLETLRLPEIYKSSVSASVAYIPERIEWGGKWFLLLPVHLYKCVAITIPSMHDVIIAVVQYI